MMSICIFGDSIAKGVVFDNIKNRYTYLTDCFINLISKKNNIKIDNYAKFGCDIKRGSEIVSKHSSSLSEYDYVFIEFGGNDCNFDWKSISEKPNEEHLPSIPLDTFCCEYKKTIDNIRSANALPIMLNLPPIDAQKFFNWVSKGNDASSILSWLGDVDHIFRWHKNYNDAVCDIASSNNVPLIDIRSAFTNLPDFSDYICDDGMHANYKGHQLIADTILNCCTV